MILVPTVPHTGSHFVSRHLLEGYTHCTLKGAIPGPMPRLIFDHLYSSKMPQWMPLLAKHPAIVPLRHPRSVCESLKRRGEDFAIAVDAFFNLVTIVDQFEPFYLPLDVKDRQRYLERINYQLGLKLKTDWPKVHQHPHREFSWHGSDEAQFRTLWKAHESFFKRFYLAAEG